MVEKLRAIAAAHNSSPAQIALAWLLTRKGVASVLVGANKIAQLEDNLGAVNVKLSVEELTELDHMTTPALVYPNWFHVRASDIPVKDALAK